MLRITNDNHRSHLDRRAVPQERVAIVQPASDYRRPQGVPVACSSGQHDAMRGLEQYLGDPNDPTCRFSLSRSLDCDEKEEYPQLAEDALRSWGAAEHLIPVALGGKLGDVAELFSLLRAVARRDLTVAVSFGANLLAALPVWIVGTEQQQHFVAAMLRQGDCLALAATERAHGSDLLANQTRVDYDSSGLRLTGEKWLISNARRARAVMVFARTLPDGGPRGSSLFLLDKQTLPTERWTPLARVPTLGLRGADTSGLRFRDCPIAEETLIGKTGHAYETLHRTLTVTKTLCGALALGAADAALRIVMDFAARRRLYGGTALEIPQVRTQLCGAFLDILVCECLAHAATRALSYPDEPSLFLAALVKYFVPTLVERVLQSLSVVLGARFFLREGPEAFFQKIVRDAAILSVFEGSTVVNLGILASQLIHRRGGMGEPAEDRRRRLKNLYSLVGDRPLMIPEALSLRSPGFDVAVAGLPEDGELGLQLERRDICGAFPRRSIGTAMRCLNTRIRSWDENVTAIEQRSAGHPHRRSPRVVDFAVDYCRFHAAASCWHTWQYGAPTGGEFFARGDWLALCLRRLLSRPGLATPSCAVSERVFGELFRRWREGRAFSLTST
jgi:alkylation response protein AidB-like acyl-CoA dehydrogenase